MTEPNKRDKFVRWLRRMVPRVGIVVLGAAIFTTAALSVAATYQTWEIVEELHTEAADPQADAAADEDDAEGQDEQAEDEAAPDESADAEVPKQSVLGIDVEPTIDTALLLLVVVASALGAHVHIATSFATYVGNRRFRWSWLWWYVLRLPIGVALALVFYFAIRGGLLGINAGGDELNPYGIAALAGMVGLFSKQAIDKLEEVFDVLFRTRAGAGDDARADKSSGVPTITAVAPASLPLGTTSPVKLTVTGTGFDEGARAAIGSSPVETTWVSETQLEVEVPVASMATAGPLEIVVTNPGSGGGTSDAFRVDVAAP